NSQLQKMLGIAKRDTLAKDRQKAVDAGWLHYEQPGNRRPGVYWVTIPAHLQGLADKAVDEAYSSAVTSQPPDTPPENGCNDGCHPSDIPPENGCDHGCNRGCNRGCNHGSPPLEES